MKVLLVREKKGRLGYSNVEISEMESKENIFPNSPLKKHRNKSILKVH